MPWSSPPIPLRGWGLRAPPAAHPRAGASRRAARRRFPLPFTTPTAHARSRLLLVGPEGAQLPLELAPELEPTLVGAALDPAAALPPGAWRLRWQVLAVDGHI